MSTPTVGLDRHFWQFLKGSQPKSGQTSARQDRYWELARRTLYPSRRVRCR